MTETRPSHATRRPAATTAQGWLVCRATFRRRSNTRLLVALHPLFLYLSLTPSQLRRIQLSHNDALQLATRRDGRSEPITSSTAAVARPNEASPPARPEWVNREASCRRAETRRGHKPHCAPMTTHPVVTTTTARLRTSPEFPRRPSLRESRALEDAPPHKHALARPLFFSGRLGITIRTSSSISVTPRSIRHLGTSAHRCLWLGRRRRRRRILASERRYIAPLRRARQLTCISGARRPSVS